MHRSHRSLLIESRARQMRSNLNVPEQALWAEIRGCRLGVMFRRQVPLGSFIVDFLAPRERLIVEVDGVHHAQRSGADARRDRKLARMGYRVLRLDAALVLAQLEEAVARIRQALTDPR